MSIFGNICSFLSVCTVCDRLAVPIQGQLTSSKQVSPRLKMGVAHTLEAHWLNTYGQITVQHVHCFKVQSMKQIVSLLITHPWFMSCSVSSSHTRTCIAFPSLHQWNISSMTVTPHKSRKCEIVNLVFVCYDNILKIHSQSRDYAIQNSCNDKFAFTRLLDWSTSTNHHTIRNAKINTTFKDFENITQFKTV